MKIVSSHSIVGCMLPSVNITQVVRYQAIRQIQEGTNAADRIRLH